MRRLTKQFIVTIGIVLGCIFIATFVTLYPVLNNLKSEYGTVRTIHQLEEYVRSHDGQWPGSEEELFGSSIPEGSDGQGVMVDYSVTAAELLAQPEKLREAVKPRSGKFHTYPHYQEKLDSLQKALKEAER